MNISETNFELTILMPCLNEAETLETCIIKAKKFLKENNVNGEILISDNGSTDGSQDIATRLGARVVNTKEKGYGAALIGGINNAKGKYIIMGDADDSYDFYNLSHFLEQLRKGYELVMGNRFKGGIKKNAMPFLHRYLGNPVLSRIGQLFFKISCSDFHCGLRGFNKESILKLDLHTTGMEFASEMVVKSALSNLKITEVPTTLSPDGRTRPPHLRTWRDGWRHLRFMLLYSPNWLFLYPGLCMILIGFVFSFLITIKPINIGKITFDIHTLLVMNILIIIGFQSFSFGMFSKVFSITEGMLPSSNKFINLFKYFNLERGIILGVIFLIIGLIGIFHSIQIWSNSAFGPLESSMTMRILIPSVTSLTMGFQLILSSFLLSILGMKRK